jgi:hypothetical protein
VKIDDSEYKKLVTKIDRHFHVFIITTCLIGAAICVALVTTGMSSCCTLLSILAFVLLLVARYFHMVRFAKMEQELRIKTYGTKTKEITNPIFQELYEEFRYDRFEGVINKGFFEKWKFEWADERNQAIDIIYTNKKHEIAITISNEEVSIIIDEETDDPIMRTILLDDEKWMDIYVLFDAITEICKNALRA